MANRSTFTGKVRSAGGDDRKVVTPAVTQVVVPFYIGDPTAANTTAVARSSSNGKDVVLPINAIVTSIMVSADATGGTNPTFDLGWVGYDDTSATDVDGLVAEGDADAGDQIIAFGDGTAGDDVGVVMSSTQPVKIIGGVGDSAPTGGTISGYIVYHVEDDGQYAN